MMKNMSNRNVIIMQDKKIVSFKLINNGETPVSI